MTLSKSDDADGITIVAWIQMGHERRETIIQIPSAEKNLFANNPDQPLESWYEGYVLDWLHAQFGWGWSGGGFSNDFSFIEGNEDGGLGAYAVTSDSSIPNTRTVTTNEASKKS